MAAIAAAAAGDSSSLWLGVGSIPNVSVVGFVVVLRKGRLYRVVALAGSSRGTTLSI